MSEAKTKDRLLDEAERLFAEKGYEDVSVREIAAASNANLAAINYHFQGKENLYNEVLRRRITPKRDRLLAALDEVENLDSSPDQLEQLFRAFVSVHLEDALRGPGGAQGIRIMSREMSDPRHGAQVILQELIEPVRGRVFAILATLTPELDQRGLVLLMGSVVGQVIHFAMNWHNMKAHAPAHGSACAPLPRIADDLESYINIVIEHVTRFALAGAEAMRKEART
jgi:AcrR family transcriptional regulator